jgi:hypothetical protein
MSDGSKLPVSAHKKNRLMMSTSAVLVDAGFDCSI